MKSSKQSGNFVTYGFNLMQWGVIPPKRFKTKTEALEDAGLRKDNFEFFFIVEKTGNDNERFEFYKNGKLLGELS